MKQADKPVEQKSGDPIGELVKQGALVLVIAVGAVLSLFVIPVAVPALIVRSIGPHLAARASFWAVRRTRWIWDVIGPVIVVGVIVYEIRTLGEFVRAGGWDALMAADEPWRAALETFGPWAVLNIVAGLTLLPLVITLYRRRLAWLVWKRRHPDVTETEKITRARKRAADLASARSIGVKVDAKTGEIEGVSSGARIAPRPVHDEGEKRQAFGIINRATVKTMPELFEDVRRVRQWTDAPGREMLLPGQAGHIRAIIAAESGTGKTMLTAALILCALEAKTPVTFLDAKGDPADAEHIAAIVRSYGHSVTIARQWNFWTGNAAQISTKLMRLLPKPDGANQHYLNEASGVLQAVQAHSPIRSYHDLRHRLTHPDAYCRDDFDVRLVSKEIDREGTTAGERVLNDLTQAYRPLEAHISPQGWSYEDRPSELTIVPISPVDEAQLKVGELMLVDLRAFIARRLEAGDKSPGLVVVDEFPQLVTDGSDPGDAAASLYETMRSAGYGLILIVQSVIGISRDEVSRRRVLSSGAAVIIGRAKDPEDVVKLAGTYMQLESSGDPNVQERLGGGRAQHTYVIPPQDIREANDGSFWIVQAGGYAHFRAYPIRERAA